jgi:Signal transduction histidine kinase
MKWNSIRTRFIIIESIFFIIIVGGASLFYNLFGEDYYIYYDAKKMEKAFYELTKINLHKLNSNQHLNQYEDQGFRFVIAEKNETIDIIYSTQIGHNSSRIRKDFYWETINESQRFTTSPKAVYSNVRLINLCGIINQKGKNYYVYVYEKTSTIKGVMEYSEKFMNLILIILILIGGGMVFYLTDKITKPIKKIDDIATKISQMDFSERIQEDKYYGEIGSLSKSINRMSEQMQRYINDLENYNYILLEENYNMSEITEIRRNFVSNMSHELKSPLAIISSQMEMIMEMGDKINRDYYYHSILEETDNMSRIVSDMLEVSFSENQLKTMEMKETNLTSLTRKLILKYDALLKQKQVRCIPDLEEACMVMGNEKYLEKAINNYLLNAYEHTENGGIIKVKLVTDRDDVSLCVFNTGNTIKETDMDNLWSRYYKESKSKAFDENHKNVGLGLYIVKSIVDQHQGSCIVKNEKDGVEFSFRLKSYCC